MTNEPTTKNASAAVDNSAEMIVTFSRDLFFGMRVRTIVGKLGYGLTLTKDEASTVEALTESAPVLALVDFNQPVDWAALEPLIMSDVPVIGFGSHTDVDGFRAAKAAGVDRVVSNGDFSRNLPELIAKYKSPSPTMTI